MFSYRFKRRAGRVIPIIIAVILFIIMLFPLCLLYTSRCV